jgi:acyl carrier protein
VGNTVNTQVMEQIRQFITENFPKARQGSLQEDDRLIEKGIIDSLGLLSLIDYLESTFQIKVSDLDVTEDKFGSIRTISKYVEESIVRKS